MTDLRDKIVFITGASSGIGRACARAFAARGAKILMAARRLDRLKALAAELETSAGVSVRAFALDVRNQPDVERAIRELPSPWEAVDILVNNAGLSRGLGKLHEGSLPDWEEMIDTNIKGLLYVSRAVLPGMVRRGTGHVINIGSLAGHEAYPGGNVYCATKFAVRAVSQGLRMDLLGTAVRVSSVDPGMVETEFSLVRFRGDAEKAGKVYEGLTPLSPEDVAEAVVFCAARPPHVDVAEIVLMPTAQASAVLNFRRKEE
ncbi:MAG: NAD(P)-dependent oxidoreductase [Candidatus Aminicenantes bacterium RBG_13_62_12]|nr:MAG: NAD(P)-dependent oxidoreductase [Candidatus Aminicenantes bacterium RBG_13_62_12]